MLSRAEAQALLELAAEFTEEDINASFKRLARIWHPDKHHDTEEATRVFQDLNEAREVLLSTDVPSFGHGDPAAPTQCPRCDKPVQPPEDAYLFRCPCGAVLRNTSASARQPAAPEGGYVPKPDPSIRAFGGAVDLSECADPSALSCVWRCTECEPEASVCCKVAPTKYSCICGHKLSAHDARRKFACGAKDCACPGYRFHVQQGGWQVRCGCKHKHTERDARTGRCLKVVGGKPCPCKGFESNWVCNCGHKWSSHVTEWVRAKHVERGREWVAGGVRPEITKIAEERREKWVKQGHAPSGASLTAQRQVFESIPTGERAPTGDAPRRPTKPAGPNVRPKAILAAKN